MGYNKNDVFKPEMGTFEHRVAFVCLMVVFIVIKYISIELLACSNARGGAPMTKQIAKTAVSSVLDVNLQLGTNLLAAALMA